MPSVPPFFPSPIMILTAGEVAVDQPGGVHVRQARRHLRRDAQPVLEARRRPRPVQRPRQAACECVCMRLLWLLLTPQEKGANFQPPAE